MSTFTDLAKINISSHIDKKGKFSYLSWAWAVNELGKVDENASWKIKRFPTAENHKIKVPYLKTELGYFVEVEVIAGGVSKTQIHPVLDNRNSPIAKPSTFQINTSIQRCLVKAIGLHGLGLSLYAGEDLPLVKDQYTPEQKEIYDDFISNNDDIGFQYFMSTLDTETKLNLFNSFEKGDITKNKELVRNLENSTTSFDLLTKYLTNNDDAGYSEIMDELSKNEKSFICKNLSGELREKVKAKLTKQSEVA